ncbi:MAG: formyl transferase [Planctomycetaceae bacterium]
MPPVLANGEHLDVPASDINSKATVQLLQSLAPDVLVVSGAPLLSPAVYLTARLGAVNVHRGITPAYRGQDSVFWSMYFGDYQNLGVTIHYLDEGIDTGPVLAQGFPAIADCESEVTMLAKSSQTAAELLLDFLDVAQRKPSGRSLNGPSRLFRARDRRIWHDARLWFRQNVLRQRTPTRPCSKIVYF